MADGGHLSKFIDYSDKDDVIYERVNSAYRLRALVCLEYLPVIATITAIHYPTLQRGRRLGGCFKRLEHNQRCVSVAILREANNQLSAVINVSHRTFAVMLLGSSRTQI